jgi:hypothetical protein
MIEKPTTTRWQLNATHLTNPRLHYSQRPHSCTISSSVLLAGVAVSLNTLAFRSNLDQSLNTEDGATGEVVVVDAEEGFLWIAIHLILDGDQR